MNRFILLFIIILFLSPLGYGQEKQNERFFNQKVEELMKQLTLEEKVSLCHGVSSMEVGGIDRLGIQKIKMTDGPQGVRGPISTYFPTGIAMAASWDQNLIEVLGAAIGRETKAAGCSVILGAGVNIMRTPLCGRNFEYFGEDPFLAGKTAVAYVNGVQSEGVAACVKHFAANNQEKWRTTNSSEVGERALREIYLPAFRMACKDANVWSIMSGYNKLNGIYCSANKCLQYDIPKVEWKWNGAMISDWGAVHETEGPVRGGMDIEMPGHENNFLGKPYLEGLKSGVYSKEMLDDKVRRVLRLILRTTQANHQKKGEANTKRHQEIAKKVAEESIVLLKNEDQVLPLSFTKIKKIAVIGPNADKQHSMDGVRGSGGSGSVNPPYEITPLQGLRKIIGSEIEIVYEEGYSFEKKQEIIPSKFFFIKENRKLKNGIDYKVFDNQELKGESIYNGQKKNIHENWTAQVANEAVPINNFSSSWESILIPPQDGTYKIGLTSDDGCRLFINGELVINEWNQQGKTTFLKDYDLKKGVEYQIKVEYFDAGGEALLDMVWEQPENTGDKFKNALVAAKEADLVLLFGGTNHSYDTEALGWGDVKGADRPDLKLMGQQDNLIKEIASVNPNTVVVLIGGGPMDVEDWIDDVKGLIMAWYPGMEGGHAIANILTGKVNPSGKLPFTWGKSLNDYACHANGNYPGTGNNGIVNYDEGIWVGYRWFEKEDINPRYPFGFGLSYTTFEMSHLKVKKDGEKVEVNVEIKNTGDHEGAEVVQLYVSDPKSSVERPLKELKGFEKVNLKPGERKIVTLELDKSSFSFFDEDKGSWRAEDGEFSFKVGSSSGKIYLSKKIKMKF